MSITDQTTLPPQMPPTTGPDTAAPEGDTDAPSPNRIVNFLKGLPLIGRLVTMVEDLIGGEGLGEMLMSLLSSMLPPALARMLPGYTEPEVQLTDAQIREKAAAERETLRLAQDKADVAAGRRLGEQFAASVTGPPAAPAASEHRQAFGNATTPPAGTPVVPAAPGTSPPAGTSGPAQANGM